jgi:hypothetical protein
MIVPPDRVLVWSSQLRANDFPPVCAMTGQPAETWKKFSFASAPWWTFFFGLLVRALVAQRANGYLPLTRASARTLALVTWGSFGLILLTGLLWIVGVVGVDVGGVFFVFMSLGVVTFFMGATGLLIVRPLIGPSAKVMAQQMGQYDSLVELRRVHPVFVMAVRQHQQARAAQRAPQFPQPT